MSVPLDRFIKLDSASLEQLSASLAVVSNRVIERDPADPTLRLTRVITGKPVPPQSGESLAELWEQANMIRQAGDVQQHSEQASLPAAPAAPGAISITATDTTGGAGGGGSLFRRRRAIEAEAAKRNDEITPPWAARPIEPGTLAVRDDRRLFTVHNGDIVSAGSRLTKQIKSISFDVLPEEQTRQFSVMKLTTKTDIESVGDGLLQPADGGLVAEKLGPIEHKRMCPTCGGTTSHPSFLNPSAETGYMCPGHFGHIELAGAVYNPELVDTLITALRCWCWHCGKLPGTDECNKRVAAELARSDVNGKPLNRAQRLALLSARYSKMETCSQCPKDEARTAAQRCSSCPDAVSQCAECSDPIWYRPQITKLQKKPFDSFPYLLHYPLQHGKKVTVAKEQQLRDSFRNYVDRLGISDVELELAPERTRAIINTISADAARWLDLEIGADDDEHRLSRVKQWLAGMAPRNLPLAPNCVRGTDVREGLQKPRFNELTVGYRDIEQCDAKLRATQMSVDQVKNNTNRRFGDGILAFKHDERWYHRSACDSHLVVELYGRLQYYWALMVRATRAAFWLPTGNRSVKVPDKARKGADQTQNKGRSFMGDLKGKEGYLRKDLQGSRCDHSARSVIVPDPNIAIDEVGISQETANRLSVPVQLCAWNIERILRRAEELRAPTTTGTVAFTGGQFMLMNEDRTYAVPYLELKTPVMAHSYASVGSWIEMPLEDGDIVVMNRQPSLHKPSMMAHRIRIIRGGGPAFRLNPNVVTPYNADFDGDEMTLHVPQSATARAEAIELMSVMQNIVLSKNGKPCIKLRQNHLLCAYLVTLDHKFLTLEEFQTLLTQMLPHNDSLFCTIPMPAIVRPRPLWTVRQLIQMLLPRSLTMARGQLSTKLLNCVAERQRHDKPPALIIRGEFVYGVMDNDLMTKMVEALYMSAAPTNAPGSDMRGTVPQQCVAATQHFLDSMTRLTECYLNDSFSIGIEDVLTDVVMRAAPPAPQQCAECCGNGRRGLRQTVDTLSADHFVRAPPLSLRHPRDRLLHRHLGPLDYLIWTKARAESQEFAAAFAKATSSWPVPQQAAQYVAANPKLGWPPQSAEDQPRELRTYVENRQRIAAAVGALSVQFATLLESCRPRTSRRPCKQCLVAHVAMPNFAIDVVPSSVRNTADEPFERQIWRRIGPVKYDAWLRARRASPNDEHASLYKEAIAAWIDNKLFWTGADPTNADIDNLERQLQASPTFCAAEPLASTKHAAEHDVALKLWQRLGPTKYAIRQRLDKVVPNVEAIITRTGRDWAQAYASGVQPMADEQIDIREEEIRKECSAAKLETHEMVFTSLKRSNGFRSMVDAETKGKHTNTGECMACVGDQQIDGARIADRTIMMVATTTKGIDDNNSLSTRSLYDPRNRFLPHDQQRYPGALEGGFVPETFVDGIKPRGFWAQATAGRSALVNTAIGTAPVGYMTRKLGKFCEGLVVDQLGMLRATDNSIVEMRVGAGYNPMFITDKVCPPLKMSEAKLHESVFIDADSDYCTFLADGVQSIRRRELVERENFLLREALAYARGLHDADRFGTLRTVNNIDRLLTECNYSTDACRHTASSVGTDFGRCSAPSWNAPANDVEMNAWRGRVIAMQRHGNGRLPAGKGLRPLSKQELETNKSDLDLLDECDAIELVGNWLDNLKHCDSVTRVELRLRLCAKQLVRRHMMSRLTLLVFMDCYAGWLRRAATTPGDAVAIVATQSFTSEGMQLTLSSFHATGTTNMAVSEGMPRGLELVGARSTAKMETPKVSAHLSRNGFTSRQAVETTAALVGAEEPFDVAAVVANKTSLSVRYTDAWRSLGRDVHEPLLARLEKRQASVSLNRQGMRKPTRAQFSTATNKKHKRNVDELFDAAVEDYEQDYNERRLELSEAFGAELSTALDACDALIERQFTQTLDSFFEGWKVTAATSQQHGKPLELRVRQEVAVVTTRDKAEFFAEYVLWDVLLPEAGAQRTLDCEALFDSQNRWISVRISHSSPEPEEREQFYNKIRCRRAEIFVQSQWNDDAVDAARFVLDYAQTLVRKKALGSSLSSTECTALSHHQIDPLITAVHRRTLRSVSFADIVDRMEILYAPLEPVPDDPSCLQLKDVSLVSSVELAYIYTGCTNGCDPNVVGTVKRKASGKKVVHQFSRTDEQCRCLSSFVLAIAISPLWLHNNADWCLEEIEPAITQALGFGHTVTFARSPREPMIHVRLHTCMLDELRVNRADPHQQFDLSAPVLSPKLFQAPVVVSDVVQDADAVSRIRRTKNDFDKPYFYDYLRQHMRDVLVNGARRRIRQHRKPKWRDPATTKALDKTEMRLASRSVNSRIAAKNNAAPVFVDIRGNRVRVRQLPREPLPDLLGEPLYAAQQSAPPPHQLRSPTPATPPQVLPGVTGSTDDDDDDNGDASVRSSLDDLQQQGELAPLTEAQEALIEDERAQLHTQAEITELHRSWKLICELRIGGVRTGAAQRIAVEEHTKTVYLPESGAETAHERVVALDSRNFLRIMNERIVDRTRSYTNAVLDTQEVLGALAARERTRAEFGAIISSGHSFIDHSHLGVLAAAQWYKGWCVPFTVHGLKHVSNDIIQKMSMEATPAMIKEAVIAGQSNDIVSASACIAFGQCIKRIGTETIQLLHDPRVQPSVMAYGRQFSAMEISEMDLFADVMQANAPALANPFERLGHLRDLVDKAAVKITTPRYDWNAVDQDDDDDDGDAEVSRLDLRFAGDEDQLIGNQYGSYTATNAAASIAATSPEQDTEMTGRFSPLRDNNGDAVPEYDPFQVSAKVLQQRQQQQQQQHHAAGVPEYDPLEAAEHALEHRHNRSAMDLDAHEQAQAASLASALAFDFPDQ